MRTHDDGAAFLSLFTASPSLAAVLLSSYFFLPWLAMMNPPLHAGPLVPWSATPPKISVWHFCRYVYKKRRNSYEENHDSNSMHGYGA